MSPSCLVCSQPAVDGRPCCYGHWRMLPASLRREIDAAFAAADYRELVIHTDNARAFLHARGLRKRERGLDPEKELEAFEAVLRDVRERVRLAADQLPARSSDGKE